MTVDIFHFSPSHPRFANVTYFDPSSGLAACQNLNGQSVKHKLDTFDPSFLKEYEEDLQVWRDCEQALTVLPHEPPEPLPSLVEVLFPDLHGWVKAMERKKKEVKDEKQEAQEAKEAEAEAEAEAKAEEEREEAEVGAELGVEDRKREREDGADDVRREGTE